MAQALGVGPASDAFLVAFKIPNFLRRLFAEGAFSQSFVPVISEYKLQRGTGRSARAGGRRRRHDGRVAVRAVSAIGVIAAPVIILVFAPKWAVTQAPQFDLAVQMLRWTFPYLFFISLASLFSGVLNSYGRFFIPAFTQVIMNLVMIVAAVWVAPGQRTIRGCVLAIGVFVAACCSWLFQLPAVAQLGLLSLAALAAGARGRAPHRRRLMVPGIIGSSMAQISLLLDTQIATFLVTRQRDLAVLRRPADGVSAGRVQHRAGHGDPAGPVR